MKLGIVITDEGHLALVKQLFDAAVGRGWQVFCFLTDTGVNLLADGDFVRRAKVHPNHVSLCEHSAERYAQGGYDLGVLGSYVVVGGQYQDAELVRNCDQVVVL